MVGKLLASQPIKSQPTAAQIHDFNKQPGHNSLQPRHHALDLCFMLRAGDLLFILWAGHLDAEITSFFSVKKGFHFSDAKNPEDL